MNHDSDTPTSATYRSPQQPQQQQQQVVQTDDDRRSRRRQRRRQLVESRENPSTTPVQQEQQQQQQQQQVQQQQQQQQASGENYKSELFVMSQQERVRDPSDSSRVTLSRSPPDRHRTIIRPVSVSAQSIIPATRQDPAERQRIGGRMTSSVTSPTRPSVTSPTRPSVMLPTRSSVTSPTRSGVTSPTRSGVTSLTKSSVTSPTRSGVTSPTRSGVTSPTRDNRHSLNSPTIPMTGGSNFLTINPPSELRVQGTPPGGTRAAIHIIDDFLHNPPRTELVRQRSLTRGGSRGSSGKRREREREQRARRLSHPQVTVGLDHLDNLCRLMEQLSSLRDENTKLKKRCNFLENTRDLLKIQNEMLLHERDDFDSEEEDTLSLGLSESTLADSQIVDDDDDVFSHMGSTTTTTSSKLVRPQHRRSQSVGSIDLIDVLPALKKQHSIPHASPFTSKFKKSIKHTRNTIRKVFSTRKEGVEYSMVRPVPTITTTPEERRHKTSQSSDRSSASPCQSEPCHHHDDQDVLSPEFVHQTKSEMHLQLAEPTVTREVVSDEACTPGYSSPKVRRRYKKAELDSYLLTRRKSSPTLTLSKEEVEDEVRRPTTPEIPRSSTNPQLGLEYSPKDDKIRGRTAWGKVKNIIHTRKDSLKKRNRKTDENRRSMTDAIFERKSAEPNESPKIDEQLTKVSSSSDTKLSELDKPVEKVTPLHIKSHGTEAQTTKALQELVGNLSEEFNRKMMEWENKKGEKKVSTGLTTSTSTGSVGERLSDIGSEYKPPQRKISHTTSFPVKLRHAGSTSPSADVTNVTLESLQKGMSDSFNRKMLEWERMRSGQPTDGYMSVEGIRRDAPWKSRSEKKTKAEKEKLRMERLREKELVKVERERQKLERDRQRLQREQQRTMRRAVELERKKEQLEDYGLVVDSGERKGHHAPLSHHQSYPYPSPRQRYYKYVNVGEYQIEGVSDEFAKRLQTWEEKKHKTKDCFHAWDQLEKYHSKTTDVGDIVIPPKFKEGQLPLPIVIRSNQGMPEQLENIHTSPQIVRVEPTYQRATLCTHETQTSPQAPAGQKGNKLFQFEDPISDLRTRNSYLSQQLRQKESESQSLQDDVEGLNRALRRMNESYTKEIASYKHQLWAGSNWGQMTEQSKFVAEAVNELRLRVDQLENMHFMETRRRPFSGDSSKNNKEKNNTQGSIEAPGRYKNLVDYVKKLHTQISDLKKGVCEREDVLNTFRKHLSLEEINKLLLNADIQRRDLELQFFKKKHKHGVIRRHCTFAGQDFCMRQGCDEKQAFKTWPKYRARCVDKIPSTFRHGNFDPESAEKDSDIAVVLRTCGISSDDPDKHQDILNGNSGIPSPRRYQQQPDNTLTRSVATQVGWDERDRYGESEYWSRDDRYYPHGVTVRVRRPDHRHDSDRSDSDSERRSRIDYGRHQMREAFFSSVTDGSSPRCSQDGSLSPSHRHTKTPPGDDPSKQTSFRVRSATYFSPKPYNKTSDDHQRLEPPSDVTRRIGPLRKLHSASELMSERRLAIAGRFQATEVRHSSLMDRKSHDDYFTDVSMRRSHLLLQQQQDLATSQTNIVSGVDVQSIAQSYDQPQDNEAGGQSVPSKELPQQGTVRRLTEVFVSGLQESTNGHTRSTRSKFSSERVTEAMQRKRSMEIPKEGTVQKRLDEFVPYSGKSSETSPTLRKRQSEIPREGMVQKRLEELKMYSSDSDRTGPDGKESRRSDSDDTATLLPVRRKDTLSSTDEDYSSSKGHSDDERSFTGTTKISHQSILLRPQPIGHQHRDHSKRLSPMEMLVRGTVSLNLDVVSPRYEDVVSPRYEDVEQTASSDDPPLSPGGTSTKRRSWFARSFFKSQK